MPRFAHFAPFRRHATWLLFLGILAMALHALAGAGVRRSAYAVGGGSKFAVEVCTSHGVVQVAPSQIRGGNSQSDSGAHDCCQLCAAGGPLLAGASAVGVPPAPTFTPLHAAYIPARQAPAVRAAHPPRGPPARA